jgi:hypothetical protein
MRSACASIVTVLAVVVLGAGCSAEPERSADTDQTSASLSTDTICPGRTTAGKLDPALVHHKLQRSVLGRMVQKGKVWIHPKSGPLTVGTVGAYVGNAVHDLDPRYVSGLLRLDRGEASGMSDADWKPYEASYAAVRAKAKDAWLDVVLGAKAYNDADPNDPACEADGHSPKCRVIAGSGKKALLADMRAINQHLHPDGWFFDTYEPGYKDIDGPHSKESIDAAIAHAHECGQFIGGNSWGDQFPPGSDFVSTTEVVDVDTVENHTDQVRQRRDQKLFKLPQASIDTLAKKTEVLIHLESDPQLAPAVACCYFMGACSGPDCNDTAYGNRIGSGFADVVNFTSWDRRSFIGSLAAGQKDGNYTLVYPLFHPACGFEGNGGGGITYNAVEDVGAGGDNMVDAIQGLLHKYNP